MFRNVCLVSLLLCLTGCYPLEDLIEPVPFSLRVVPTEMGDTLPGQRCVLLVTVESEESGLWGALPVTISASAPGATVVLEHQNIRPGQVAEVTLIPQAPQGWDPNDAGPQTLTATIRGQRAGLQQLATVPITITSLEEDLVAPLALEVRDLFIPWLAENRPELGITAQTEWTGTIVTPHILVVTHYLYFSDDWEMHVYWHVMIPPYDWARIELRRRFEETLPSLAFEIPSRSAEPPLEAVAIEPADALWR
jgi:hypothetical protein